MSYLFCKMFLSNPIPTEVFPLAFGTVGSLPVGVEVIGCGIDQLGVVGEDVGLEVADVFAFHSMLALVMLAELK